MTAYQVFIINTQFCEALGNCYHLHFKSSFADQQSLGKHRIWTSILQWGGLNGQFWRIFAVLDSKQSYCSAAVSPGTVLLFFTSPWKQQKHKASWHQGLCFI